MSFKYFIWDFQEQLPWAFLEKLAAASLLGKYNQNHLCLLHFTIEFPGISTALGKSSPSGWMMASTNCHY